MFTIIFCKQLLTDVREVVVVQLQFLALMIRKESDVVPMGAAIHSDLIDLMARVLVVVFHEKRGRVDDRSLVQSQDQTGASGSQSDCLPAVVQRETSSAQ